MKQILIDTAIIILGAVLLVGTFFGAVLQESYKLQPLGAAEVEHD